jgi:hypothetical protein
MNNLITRIHHSKLVCTCVCLLWWIGISGLILYLFCPSLFTSFYLRTTVKLSEISLNEFGSGCFYAYKSVISAAQDRNYPKLLVKQCI